MLYVVIIVLLVLAVVGMPTWPHAGWGMGWYPSGGLGLVLVILLVLLLAGRL